MPVIAVVDPAAGTAERLRSACGGDSVSMDTVDELVRRFESDAFRPDVAVIGPGVPEPIYAAQRLRSLDARLPVILLAPDGELMRLTQVAEAAPLLARDVTVVADSENGERLDELIRAASRADPPSEQTLIRALGALLDQAPIGGALLDDKGVIVATNRFAAALLGDHDGDALGVPLAERFEDRASLERFLAEAVHPDAALPPRVFARSDGVAVLEVTLRPLVSPAGIAGVALIQDVTGRVAAEAERDRLLEQAERMAARLARLHAVTAALSSSVTRDEALETIVVGGTAALGADAGCASLLSDDGTSLVVVQAAGYRADVFTALRIPVDADLPMPQAVRTGEVVFLTSTQERDARYPQLVGTVPDLHSTAIVAIVAWGRAAGALAFSYLEERTFDDEDASFLRALAHQCGQALERTTLFEAERRARAEAEAAEARLALLAEASTLLSASLDVAETADALARFATDAMADWAAVDVLDADGAVTRLAMAHSEAASTGDVALPFAPADVIRSGAPELLADVADDRIRSAMSVPLIARGRTFGALTFATAQPGRTYSRDDLVLAELIGRRAALALDNARLHRDAQRARERLEFQSSLLHSLSEASVDGILVIAQDGTVLSYNARFVQMWEIPDDLLQPERQTDALALVLDKLSDPEAIVERGSFLMTHPDERSREEVALKDGRILDLWSSPLAGEDGEYFGRAFYFRDITWRKRLEGTLRRGRERFAFLARAGEVLSESLDVGAVLERLTGLAIPALADLCVAVADVGDEAGAHRGAIATAMPSLADAAQELRKRLSDDSTEDDVLARVRSTGKAEIVAGERFAPGGRSAMVVPLRVRERVLGLVVFVFNDSGRTHEPRDITLAEDLCARAALALDNARLYTASTRVAQTLQRSLLPPVIPQLPIADVAACYHAAGAAVEVGGDFYDVFATRGNAWALVIGDVCGKGAEAAALTALARYTIRAAAMQMRRPRAILRTLNDAIAEHSGGDRRFCTVAFGVLRPAEGGARVTMSCGGHPLPLVLRDDGRIDEAGAPGTLLGVYPDPELRDVETRLAPGDTLFLYTDGVTEAPGPNGMFTDGMLRRVLAGAAGQTAGEIVRQAERAVLEFHEGRARDDIAMLAVRIRP